MKKELKYDGWLKIYNIKDTNKNGVTIDREIMSRATGNKSDDSVAGLLYDINEDLYYLVSQYRAGVSDEDRYLVEAVAGTLEVGEDPLTCFEREAMEEVGFKCNHTQSVGSFYTSPGGTSEKMHLFLSMGKKTNVGGGLESENEDIEVLEYTYEQLINETIIDLKTIYLINLLQNAQETEETE